MEVYAGFVSFTDHHFGRILDTLEEIGELDNTLIMVISDNGASAEGGPQGSVNEMLFFNNVAESLEDNLAQIDTLGDSALVQPLPVGLGLGWRHPVPPLEAGDLPGRIDRPLRRRLAEGNGHARRGARAVRARDRHGARPSSMRSASSRRPRSEASHRPRSRACRSAPRSPTRPRRPRTPRSTSRCSDIARSTTTAGGRSARGRASTSRPPPRRDGSSARRSHRRCSTSSRREGWELYEITDDPTESRNVAAEHPEKLRELVALWWVEAGKYKVLPIDGDVRSRLVVERPQTSRPRTRFTYYPGPVRDPAAGDAEDEQPPTQYRGRRDDSRGRRRGRAAGAGRCCRRLRVLREGRQAPLHAQLRGTGLLRRGVRRGDAGGSARASVRVRAHRPARHPVGQGCARAIPALRRRHARRRSRRAPHDADLLRAGRALVRLRLRRTRPRGRLRLAVRVHGQRSTP